eukprot:141314_1
MLLLLTILFHIVYGDEQDFDCPMRALGVEYATYINPYITHTQLMDICDAINGSPEAQNCTITPPINHKPLPRSTLHHMAPADDIPTIYVDAKHGNDNHHHLSIHSITNPLKTIQAAIDFARIRYGASTLKKISIREGKYHLPSTIQIGPHDSNLILTNYQNETVNITGARPLNNLKWQVHKKVKGYTIYKTHVNKSIQSITGLRINGFRGILARYPNADPEIDGFGSSQFPQKWVMPTNTQVDYEYVNEVPEYQRNDTPSGGGYPLVHTNYLLYVGGDWLSRMTPPASYWPGGIPIGLQYNATVLPNAPYQNPSQMIVAAWRQAHWESWFWDINMTRTIPLQEQNILMFGNGGNQGGRQGSGAEFYVMNVMEELDAPNEFFYNKSECVLYYIPNATDFESFEFEATNLNTLITIEGNQTHPVRGVVVASLNFIDSAFTGLEDHGVPSGGDWALQYSGAVEIIGAENVTVSDNLFSRCDGNAVFIFNYNRNISVTHNEFVWIGDSCIVSWGSTEGIDFPELDAKNVRYAGMGIDGTGGNQPRFLNISYNIAHEIGIFEKQSSLYFQAKSCQNYVSHNIFYNGPRAGILFNDGFGGGSLVERNFMFNTCRESGDHGSFNSWDRQPYVTKVGLYAPKAHITKQYDECRYNFLLSNYNAVYPLDNDDTSQYYRHYNNFLIYGISPYKSNFGGHNIHHWNNIYAYSYRCGEIFDNEPLRQSPDIWENCTCILSGTAQNTQRDYMTITRGCGGANSTFYPNWNGGFISKNNIIQQKNANMNNLGLCGVSQTEFTATTGNGKGTVITDLPSTRDLLKQARDLLYAT